MTLTSLQLFKILSDETRLGIVLLLKQLGELCVCDLCTGLESRNPRSHATWQCSESVGCCWIVSRGSGCIIVFPRISCLGSPGC